MISPTNYFITFVLSIDGSFVTSKYSLYAMISLKPKVQNNIFLHNHINLVTGANSKLFKYDLFILFSYFLLPLLETDRSA